MPTDTQHATDSTPCWARVGLGGPGAKEGRSLRPLARLPCPGPSQPLPSQGRGVLLRPGRAASEALPLPSDPHFNAAKRELWLVAPNPGSKA